MGAVVSPQTENDVVEIVRDACADRRTFDIVGRGTKRGLGLPVDASAVLDLSALSGIVRYEPEELVITARAATPVAEIEKVLAEKNQRLGFDPADWGLLYGASASSATIGGALSADASGSARLRYGAARDHLLGYRAVNGLGEIYKAGGHVVKNVTGFDLPKLVCGAMGTLGPLTEVTLRLVPRSANSATLVVRNVAAPTGLALLRRIWSSPLEPSGLAYVPHDTAREFTGLGEVGDGAALFRIDGAPEPLADKCNALRKLLHAQDCEIAPEGNALFAQIGAGRAFIGRPEDLWRVFVPPASASACVEALSPSYWFADWAGGVLWIATRESDTVHAIAAQHGGHATLMRSAAATHRRVGVFPSGSPARAALTRRVKTAFDPLGLFNPGRMFEMA
jgi:glycolate oxidase FAD binding subunit